MASIQRMKNKRTDRISASRRGLLDKMRMTPKRIAEDYTRKYPPQELFRKIFGFEPKNKIDVHIDNNGIIFIMNECDLKRISLEHNILQLKLRNIEGGAFSEKFNVPDLDFHIGVAKKGTEAYSIPHETFHLKRGVYQAQDEPPKTNNKKVLFRWAKHTIMHELGAFFAVNGIEGLSTTFNSLYNRGYIRDISNKLGNQLPKEKVEKFMSLQTRQLNHCSDILYKSKDEISKAFGRKEAETKIEEIFQTSLLDELPVRLKILHRSALTILQKQGEYTPIKGKDFGLLKEQIEEEGTFTKEDVKTHMKVRSKTAQSIFLKKMSEDLRK